MAFCHYHRFNLMLLHRAFESADLLCMPFVGLFEVAGGHMELIAVYRIFSYLIAEASIVPVGDVILAICYMHAIRFLLLLLLLLSPPCLRLCLLFFSCLCFSLHLFV